TGGAVLRPCLQRPSCLNARQRLAMPARADHTVHDGGDHEAEHARWCENEQRTTQRDRPHAIPGCRPLTGLAERADLFADTFRRSGRKGAQIAHELLELTLEVGGLSRWHRSSSPLV